MPADDDAPGHGDVKTDDLLLVGRVLKAHGTGGEVKVIPETDDPARLDAVETIYLGRTPEQAAPHAVTSVRHQVTKRGPLALVKLDGIDGRGDADALRQLYVYATEDALPPLEDDEQFIHDLVGLAVVTEDGEHIGTVRTVEPTAAHDVFVVERDGPEPPAMIPAVEEFVREVDLEEGRLVVRLIEGLL